MRVGLEKFSSKRIIGRMQNGDDSRYVDFRILGEWMVAVNDKGREGDGQQNRVVFRFGLRGPGRNRRNLRSSYGGSSGMGILESLIHVSRRLREHQGNSN